MESKLKAKTIHCVPQTLPTAMFCQPMAAIKTIRLFCVIPVCGQATGNVRGNFRESAVKLNKAAKWWTPDHCDNLNQNHYICRPFGEVAQLVRASDS
jgi:hypothetical protein